MELGIDKQQIEKAKELGRKVAGDPALLRLVVCLLILVVGWLVSIKPQGEALARAHKKLRKATELARKAEELTFYTTQMKRYEPRLFSEADLVAFQNYVLGKLELSGARLRTLEPKKTESKGVFKILGMSLDASGTYQQLADFVHRLEHGEKVVRFARLRLERRKTIISMECEINAMVKPAKAQGDKGQGDAKAGAGPAAGAAPAGEPTAGGATDGTESGSSLPADEGSTADSAIGFADTDDGDDV